MSLKKVKKQIDEITSRYETFLAEIPEKDFQKSPASGGWSYSEVYSHILEANLLSLLALEKCVKGKAEESTKSTHLAVWLILFFGKFPPGKIKAPKRIAALVQKIHPAEAEILMAKFKTKLNKLAPLVAQASHTHKAKHPRLGLLNARQWLRFIEIHSRHHEKQLGRIQSALK